MIHMAGQMQYEDDYDDQNIFLDKNRNKTGYQ